MVAATGSWQPGTGQGQTAARDRIAMSVAVVIAGLALVACACLADAEGAGPHPALGMVVADFTLLDMRGGAFRLADVQEPVVVLNLFAFWCDTWIEQLPQLRALATHQEDLGFRLISISVDGRWSDRLRQVCGDDLPEFPVLLDSGGVLSGPLVLRHVPTIIILDRDRRVRLVFEAWPGNHVVLRAIRRTASTWLEAPSTTQ